jgi:hypothetical protein
MKRETPIILCEATGRMSQFHRTASASLSEYPKSRQTSQKSTHTHEHQQSCAQYRPTTHAPPLPSLRRTSPPPRTQLDPLLPTPRLLRMPHVESTRRLEPHRARDPRSLLRLHASSVQGVLGLLGDGGREYASCGAVRQLSRRAREGSEEAEADCAVRGGCNRKTLRALGKTGMN